MVCGEGETVFFFIVVAAFVGELISERIVVGGLFDLIIFVFFYFFYNVDDIVYWVIYVEVSCGCLFKC